MNKFRELAQAVKTHIKGTNTIKFIAHSSVPHCHLHKILSDIRPQKEEPNQCPITISGNRIVGIDYPRKVSTKTVDLTTIKLLLKSVFSDPTGCFMTADVKELYLNTLLDERHEYMCISIKLIPQFMNDNYHLTPLAHQDYGHVEIDKGI